MYIYTEAHLGLLFIHLELNGFNLIVEGYNEVKEAIEWISFNWTLYNHRERIIKNIRNRI